MSRAQYDSEGPQGAFFSTDVIRGVPWAVFGKFSLFFVYFAIPIFTFHSLGKDKYGVFSICTNIGDFLILLCSLGLNTALVRFIPELCLAQNRAGLLRLIGKTAIIQAGMVFIAALVMLLVKPYFDRWFRVDFQYFLLFAVLLVAARLFAGLIDDAFVGLLLVRVTSVLSICQALVTLALVAWILPRAPEVSTAIVAYTVPAGLVGAAGLLLLMRRIRRLHWRSPQHGIGRRRTLRMALPSLFNAMSLMVLAKYSEIFFLGYFFTPAVVAMYDVGCGFSLMIVTFIPNAIQKLFTSGFAQAYSRDEECLAGLIESYYKALIVFIVPISAFGLAFGPCTVEILYGEDMAPAGFVAAVFFIYYTLTIIAAPLSMAIVTKEKILYTQPLMVLQIVVNLILDYLLIPRFQLYGALAAVTGTWVLTIPVRLYVVSRLVGGIHFPTRFFLRTAAVVCVLAGVMSPAAPHLNLVGVILIGIVYGGAYLVLQRLLHLVRYEDTRDLRNLGLAKLNKALDWLVAGKPRENGG